MNLYEISNEYQQVLNDICEIEGITQEVINDTLSPISTDFKIKAINLTSYFKNLEVDCVAMKEAEKSIGERRKRIENKVEYLKTYLKNEMINTGINKIECPYFNITLSKSKPSVEVIDQESIPEEFIRTTIKKEADKNAISLAGGCEGVEIKESWALRIK